jgi:urease accessory protein
MNSLALLHFLNLVSPSLPIGAFAWSQGLEYAVEEGWVSDEASLQEWVEGVMRNAQCRLDVPCLLRCHRAWQDHDRDELQRWNQLLLASREGHELQLEDVHTGAALIKLLTQLAPDNDAIIALRSEIIALPTAFAIAAAHWQISAADAALGYLWSWTENQVAAAIKLVPLGQTAGQRVLQTLKTVIPAATQHALGCPDDDIGAALPGLAIASARHETQYSRLFRS